jgi:ketosteroid isomerase-like protein
MHRIFLTLVLLCVAGPAFAEDTSDLLKRQTQELYDALVPGDAAVWDRYLDANAALTDENGVLTGKKDTVAEVTPLPKGISGAIAVTDWHVVFHGDIAVATHVVDEHENFHGQQLHALYRTTTTWVKDADGWKILGQQSIALQQDPPAVPLPVAVLDEYVGRYRAAPDLTYVIARQGDDLVGGVEGGKPGPLKMELRDVMFAPGQPRVRKIFTRDTSGQVTGFLSRREARDVVWTRIPPK